jgi:hypothetical protein
MNNGFFLPWVFVPITEEWSNRDASAPSQSYRCGEDGSWILDQYDRRVGFGTGIPRVGFSHTVPEPVNTVPVAGTGTYPTVKFTVSYGTRGTIGTRGFLVLLLLYFITIIITILVLLLYYY